jgi:hypothetical protein
VGVVEHDPAQYERVLGADLLGVDGDAARSAVAASVTSGTSEPTPGTEGAAVPWSVGDAERVASLDSVTRSRRCAGRTFDVSNTAVAVARG